MALLQVANQKWWDLHVTHIRTNDRCSSLTSAPRKGAAAKYRACAADWRVLSLSIQQSDKQAAGVFFSIIIIIIYT